MVKGHMESEPGYKGRCAASWCEIRGTNSSANFFRFPPDDSRCNKWRKFVLRGDLERLTSKQMHLWYFLCSEHFVESDFSDPDRTKLLSSAVPSLIYPRTRLKDPRGNSEGTCTQELLARGRRAQKRRLITCSAPGCLTNSRNSNAPFFRFPKNNRCNAWIEFTGREDLKEVPRQKLFNNLRLCALHFKDEDFTSSAKERLIRNAVPSVRPERTSTKHPTLGKRASTPGHQPNWSFWMSKYEAKSRTANAT